jgi:urease accessory protein UreF
VAAECADLGVEDLAQTAPVVDIIQAGHDHLYSRLFQS